MKLLQKVRLKNIKVMTALNKSLKVRHCQIRCCK